MTAGCNPNAISHRRTRVVIPASVMKDGALLCYGTWPGRVESNHRLRVFSAALRLYVSATPGFVERIDEGNRVLIVNGDVFDVELAAVDIERRRARSPCRARHGVAECVCLVRLNRSSQASLHTHPLPISGVCDGDTSLLGQLPPLSESTPTHLPTAAAHVRSRVITRRYWRYCSMPHGRPASRAAACHCVNAFRRADLSLSLRCRRRVFLSRLRLRLFKFRMPV